MIDYRESTVLITGGAGFVGSYVVRDLLAQGRSVVVYDASPSGNSISTVLPGAGADTANGRLVLERGGVADGWHLLRVCEAHQVDRIVHLASPLTQDLPSDPSTGIRDICHGTAAVFETARALKIARVVWASSIAVFGARVQYPDGPLANGAAHMPTSLYGSCKSLCEQMALTYREHHGVDSIGLRLTVVYGPGRMRGYMSFPSELIRSAAAGGDLDVPLADVAMNWQYVADVAGMIVHALDAPTPSDVAFNTTGDVRTFRDAAEILSRLAPESVVRLTTEPRDAAERSLCDSPAEFDDGELRYQLGYRRRYSLEQGITDAFDTLRGRTTANAAPAS